MSTGISEERIRQRAFELFLERGASHGNDREDWFRAESELRENTGSMKRASSVKRLRKTMS
ncbi:MAG: DUF2934 domain-containing protein [Chitinispirillaceae bacterium]|nr:DUF2934 domain-containing protein [Chitinispirillaceae bacterium]